MIFAGMLVIFIAAIVFFHFVQGFFSATLSAIFTVIAAVFALSYHETIVENYLGGRVADWAHGMVLLALFAVIYLVLRVIFDNVVPGNVRVPSGIDKGGALVMGLIAAVFATGIMAIAAQYFPFGTDIGGYARFAIEEQRNVTVPTAGRSADSKEWDELSSHTPGELGAPKSLILPVDDIVVGEVNRLSTDGALSAGKPLASIHPHFLDELFAERLGLEAPANHVAMNLPDQRLEAVKVLGLYHMPAAAQRDQKDDNVAVVRSGGPLKSITPNANQMFLVVRVMFASSAEDKDRLVRFSPGGARLTADVPDPATGEVAATDYYPVGTLEGTNTLFLNKVDDYLFVDMRDKPRGADLVYLVDKRRFADKAPANTFFEFKRLGRVDLSGQPVKGPLPPDADIAVLRKVTVLPPPPPPDEDNGRAPAPAQPAPSAAQPAPSPGNNAGGTFTVASARASDALSIPVTIANGDENKPFTQVPGGTGGFKDGKALNLNVDATAKDENLPKLVTQFVVPDGSSMVQVMGTPASAAPWAPALEPEQFELTDSAGKKYQPNGVLITYEAQGGKRVHISYHSDNTISGFNQPENAGQVQDVVFMYLVPKATAINGMNDHGKPVGGTVNVTAP